MSFLLDLLFSVFNDTLGGVFTAFLSLPFTILADVLVGLLTPPTP